MVTLFRLSQRRLPAVIAILAILLLFIAPEVSKTLEHRRVTGSSESAQSQHPQMPAMVMDHSMMAHSAMHPQPATHHAAAGSYSAHHADSSAPASGMSMMDDIACSYCLFLLHFPLLMWIVFALMVLLELAFHTPSRQIHTFFPATFFAGLSQPRAPPAC